jgi:cystathionine beta-lyase
VSQDPEQAARTPDPQLVAALDAVDLAVLRRRRSIKWRSYPPDVIPAWIAEMDFPLAAPIGERLRAATEAGDLGYPAPDASGPREALAGWLSREYGWNPAPDAVVVVADAMRGIELAIAAHSTPGDAIVVPTPVYPPFLAAVRDAHRKLVEVPLVRRADRFALNLPAIAEAFETGARMLLLCNPHNPTGHVTDAAELAALVDAARARRAVIVSDEVHSPLTAAGVPFVPIVRSSRAAAACTITVTAASKAWNTPGLRCAFLVAEDPDLLDPVLALPLRSRKGVGILGIEASIAAYSAGEEWRAALRALLDRNRRLVVEAGAAWDGVEVCYPDATYLAWLDCRPLSLPGGPYRFFLDHAGVALSDGAAFGSGGDGFVRLNFATGRGVLAEILERIERALRDRDRPGGRTRHDSSTGRATVNPGEPR